MLLVKEDRIETHIVNPKVKVIAKEVKCIRKLKNQLLTSLRKEREMALWNLLDEKDNVIAKSKVAKQEMQNDQHLESFYKIKSWEARGASRLAT